MNRLLSKAILLAGLSMLVSGCIYDMSGTGSSGTPATTDGMTVTTDADKAAEPVRAAGGGPLGGYIEQFMDANDKSRMVRALDGGLGKANRWKNPVSGAEFSVTPLSKVSMKGEICRTYSVSMTKTGIADRVTGTACIGEDGVWHAA